MDSNILYSTLLLALLFGCVVYASATVSLFHGHPFKILNLVNNHILYQVFPGAAWLSLVRRGPVVGAAWLSWWCGEAQFGAAWLSWMVRRGSVGVRRGSVAVRRGSVVGAA